MISSHEARGRPQTKRIPCIFFLRTMEEESYLWNCWLSLFSIISSHEARGWLQTKRIPCIFFLRTMEADLMPEADDASGHNRVENIYWLPLNIYQSRRGYFVSSFIFLSLNFLWSILQLNMTNGFIQIQSYSWVTWSEVLCLILVRFLAVQRGLYYIYFRVIQWMSYTVGENFQRHVRSPNFLVTSFLSVWFRLLRS